MELKINCNCGNKDSFNALYHETTCPYRQDMFANWWRVPDHGVVCYKTDTLEMLQQKTDSI